MVRRAILFLACVLSGLTGAAAEPRASPAVVVSVGPVQSLVAEVMAGAGTPALLIPPGASPHDYALKPSDAQRLRDAALVIWVGATLEPALVRVMAGLAPRRVVTLIDEPRLIRHGERRSGAVIRPLGGDSIDPHLWLDPRNAVTILQLTAEALAAADPAQAALYHRNAAAAAGRVRALDARMATMLAPVRARPYLVFHDAYQYLEVRYGLQNRGFVVPRPEHLSTGARHIRVLRRIIRTEGVRCLFTEPEHEPRLIAPVVEGLPVRVRTLDHLGASLAPGPDLYQRMMMTLARDLAACLKGASGSS